MVDDFVRARGYLTLGSRLKRLGEHMQADVADVSTQLGMPVGAGLLTALAAIETNGSLSVNELAGALGVSQPAATKLAARLGDAGLVAMHPHPDDKRARVLTPTAAGKAIVLRGQEILWPAVEAAVAELCGTAGGSLLDQLDAIDAGLTAEPLAKRILRRIQSGEGKDDTA